MKSSRQLFGLSNHRLRTVLFIILHQYLFCLIVGLDFVLGLSVVVAVKAPIWPTWPTEPTPSLSPTPPKTVFCPPQFPPRTNPKQSFDGSCSFLSHVLLPLTVLQTSVKEVDADWESRTGGCCLSCSAKSFSSTWFKLMPW